MASGDMPARWQALLDQAGGSGGAGAAGGADTSGDSAGMRLAGAPAADAGDGGGGGRGGGEGGDGDGLKNAKSPWDAASGSLGTLRTNVDRALREMRTGNKGAGRGDEGVAGLESAAMYARVFDSWEARLELVRDECAEVSGKLDKANGRLVKGEQGIKDLFARYEARPKPPPGGPGGGW